MGEPSDRNSRQELARRLCNNHDFEDVAGMNLSLHAQLLKRIAAPGNGHLSLELLGETRVRS
ncbi:MAG: hypothetical protein K0Q76_3589 [Panacagrimonas sp.]|jgi:hypothetical protein|nr:hypothetical protein [Panacagrimonas sp.]MCC2658481.1 hypothetical protein [Panacagrimonas sp.]